MRFLLNKSIISEIQIIVIKCILIASILCSKIFILAINCLVVEKLIIIWLPHIQMQHTVIGIRYSRFLDTTASLMHSTRAEDLREFLTAVYAAKIAEPGKPFSVSFNKEQSVSKIHNFFLNFHQKPISPIGWIILVKIFLFHQ